MTKPIEFWFSIGSTYTYLTVSRLKNIEKETGAIFDWRPFSVRALMQEMNNVPFIGKPIKEKYMWRDVRRRADRYGIPLNLPIEYPLKDFDLANRVAIVAQLEGWCPEYVTAAYKLWFCKGLAAGEEPNLRESLNRVGESYERVLEVAGTDSIHRAYQAATSLARELDIFGSPSFVVEGSELFWGDDRLEDAIEYSRRSHTAN